MGEDRGVSNQECKHGFELEFCDICSPRSAPEPMKPARRTTPVERAPRAPRSTTGTPSPRPAKRPASGSPRGPIINTATHRVFHVTHRDTLEWILEHGELRSDTETPVDLSTPLIRELRASVPATFETATEPATTVAECVSFALSDQASWWRDLRDGALDRTRWSDAARALRPSDLVVLVATLGALPDAVVTDADAASAVARIARTPEEITRVIARVKAGTGALEGEVLVPRPVTFESIVLIGVANEPARDRVREMLSASGREDVRVALSPEWFAPTPPV